MGRDWMASLDTWKTTPDPLPPAVMQCAQCGTVLGSAGDEVDVHTLPEAVGQAVGLDIAGPVLFCADRNDDCRLSWLQENVDTVVRLLQGRETTAYLSDCDEVVVPPPDVRLAY